MRYRFTSLLTIAAFLMCAPPLAGAAHVLGSVKLQTTPSLVQKVHGFHCRPELGWDPRSGVSRRHSHAGICENYKRCLQVHHRCIFVNGRGLGGWKYENWGWDNWRYTDCMIERGCY